MMNHRIFLLLALCLFSLQGVFAESNGVQEKRESYQGKTPKYVFYFIGDGFGLSQSNAAEAYMAAVKDKDGVVRMVMNTFPKQGFYTTYAQNRFITGSAAAGTALATGHKTSINTIGMDAAKQKPYKSIAEKARDHGYKVGVVTSVSLDHATPASFYAHRPSRNDYYDISVDLANSNFNFFGGGGIKHPEGDKKAKKSKSSAANMGLDSGEKINGGKKNSLQIAKKNGYTIVNSNDDFNKIKAGDDKIIAINEKLSGGKSLPYSIDQKEGALSLADYTQKAIDVLDNDQKGFFLMVEGGKIDWSCHANDAATAIKEVIQFDNAIQKAYAFYEAHPDETLIVVCGDHETGGLGLGFSGSHYHSAFKLLENQKNSYEVFSSKISKLKRKKASFDKVLKAVEENYGFNNGVKAMKLSDYELSQLKQAYDQSFGKGDKIENKDQYYQLYGSYEPITVTAGHILAQKAGIGWTTFSHTATPIPVRAIGSGSTLFEGYFDNTDLPKNIEVLMNL
ncbi:alkaline phosphatase [Halosquirtibacter laminarini]|uniref:Alkaline phosphatase n=1 Tax=Halosquirtibacter laminarini TaxID=3374600 RepID=A0AC61NPQ1_9BACT|nr:alkaline phosphatase [Prolixibacteraceae bacterium]